MGTDRNSDAFLRKWLRNREIGKKSYNTNSDDVNLHSVLYNSTKVSGVYDPTTSSSDPHYGGIFNFDFSYDGSILVAACERNGFLVFDPGNASLINHKKEAHTDCVNYVKFLDNRLFATCSDDSTVTLWDIRFLKDHVQVMKGHTSWVKNIEYVPHMGVLLTSGFDGCVYTWDLNRYTEKQVPHKKVFHTSGLMRSSLTRDGKKLIVSTNYGYIIVIHNLDLERLDDDLQGFKPNMYRLMQLSQTTLRIGVMYNYLFERKRNRVEFISDFPNDADVVSSLQIHPQGWCALTRNTSSDENSEWTCVHDIQENSLKVEDNSQDMDAASAEADRKSSSCISPSPDIKVHSRQYYMPQLSGHEADVNSAHSEFLVQTNPCPTEQNTETTQTSRTSGNRSNSPENSLQHSETPQVRLPNGFDPFSSNLDNQQLLPFSEDYSSSSTSDASEDSIDLAIARLQRNKPIVDTISNENDDTDGYQIIGVPRVTSFMHRLRHEVHQRADLIRQSDAARNKIHQNTSRLVFYKEEANVGRGFIKEVCFSSDGRVVCSPYGYGVRLLSFDPSCQEISDCVPKGKTLLHEVGYHASHKNVVVTTKFSPTHCLFVSGCLNGRVCFYHPVL